MATEISAQIGRPAAEHRWHIDAARNGQPRPRAGLRCGHGKFSARRNEGRVTCRKILLAEPNGESPATPRHDALILKPKPQSSQSSFKSRG
jgi:hypothetical protein